MIEELYDSFNEHYLLICKELQEWDHTGILSDGEVRHLAQYIREFYQVPSEHSVGVVKTAFNQWLQLSTIERYYLGEQN